MLKKLFKWIAAILLLLLLAFFFLVPALTEMRLNRVLNPPPYSASAAARALHRTLFVADLHADSLLRRSYLFGLRPNNVNFSESPGEVKQRVVLAKCGKKR